MPGTVALALELREIGNQPILDVLIDYLRKRRLLLVLDNCEHVIEASAQLCETLLRISPGLRILATSREALRVAGETAWRVPSLSVPDPTQRPSLDQLAHFAAARLFIERATAVRPDFAAAEQTAASIVQICCQLDGIPLALELAAARVNSLSVAQIAARLEDRFHLLTLGSRTALPRHQTLRALIDWSHDLLTEPERVLLRRLSVFAGGWTLDAAEAVCSGGVVGVSAVLDLLAQLVDKSLVVMVHEPGMDTRYRLLETLRQYAQEKLNEAGEAQITRHHHVDFFLDLAITADPEIRGPQQVLWLDRLEREHDNLRAALAWTQDSAPQRGLQLAGAFGMFWSIRGYWKEGYAWLETLLTRGDGVTIASRAKALLAESWLVMHGNPEQSASLAEEGLTLYRETGDKWNIAFSLNVLSIMIGGSNPGRANALCQEGLALFQQVEDTWGVALTLAVLGETALHGMHDYQRLAAFNEQSVALLREVGDRWGLAHALLSLAEVPRSRGDYARTRAMWEESFALFREVGDTAYIGWLLFLLGDMARLEGDFTQGKALLEESMMLSQKVGNKLYLATALNSLGRLALAQRHDEQARALFEESAALDRELGSYRGPNSGTLALINLGLMALDAGDHGRAAGCFMEGLSAAQATSSTAYVILCLAGLGRVALSEGNLTQAARLLGTVEAIAKNGPWAIDLVEYAPTLTVTDDQLDRQEYAEAWAEGNAMSLEQAVRYALDPSQ